MCVRPANDLQVQAALRPALRCNSEAASMKQRANEQADGCMHGPRQPCTESAKITKDQHTVALRRYTAVPVAAACTTCCTRYSCIQRLVQVAVYVRSDAPSPVHLCRVTCACPCERDPACPASGSSYLEAPAARRSCRLAASVVPYARHP